MNVQISPLQPPPTRGDELDARDSEKGSRLRTYAIGGAVLALVLGGFWYFSHPAAPPARRSAIAPARRSASRGNVFLTGPPPSPAAVYFAGSPRPVVRYTANEPSQCPPS